MRSQSRTKTKHHSSQIRYAVVGLGYIAQAAVLPAFKNARENSTLAALVSDDADKLKKLGSKYKVPLLCDYDHYDQLLESDLIDAVYIAVPNSLHLDFALRATKAGKHVLCEKPLAVTTRGCLRMLESARQNDVRLMTAYRLHFEAATLNTLDQIRKGRIGEPRIFNALFAFQIKDDNVRLERDLGGGTIYDLGIYCINAARHVFQAEPHLVSAISATDTDERFGEIDEMTAGTLMFPGGALATFVSSFGAADRSVCEIVGTRGSIRLDPAFDYSEALKQEIALDGRSKTKAFPKVDQFAPELIHFSQSIIEGTNPEPSGREGLADVRVIEALYRSAALGRPVELPRFGDTEQPSIKQQMHRPAVNEPRLFHARGPSEEDLSERRFGRRQQKRAAHFDYGP
ncbi:MAG: Gfo/Idh/MocA family oxidoreductase [Oligoflexia bacterium]|nr:Gfo/Idh/MocA family oxidoreductase [Oligoflexia bacterium]